jgi:phage tail-like protein
MPTARHDDPYAKFHFVIEFEMMKAGFSEVEGLPTDNDTDYPSSSERTEIRKLPGKRKYTNISLKRGYTNSRELYTWGKSEKGGKTGRLSGTITAYSESQRPTLVWKFQDASPQKWEEPAMNATTSEIAIEALEICVEGLALIH